MFNIPIKWDNKVQNEMSFRTTLSERVPFGFLQIEHKQKDWEILR